MVYERALIMGEVDGDIDLAAYMPTIKRFGHIYMEEESNLSGLLRCYSIDMYENYATRWLIEPYGKRIRRAALEQRLLELLKACDLFVALSQASAKTLPYKIESAVSLAKVLGVKYFIIRLPNSSQRIDHIQTGLQITSKRQEAGLTVLALAKRCKRKTCNIKNIEEGAVKSRFSTYHKIADALSIPVSEIVIWTNKNN